MNTLKTLAVAAALVATIMPAKAQFPLGYTIFNNVGQPAAVGMPQPQFNSTKLYRLDGKPMGSTVLSAITVGNVLSLLKPHIGCTDKAKAQIAYVDAHLADPIACSSLYPNVPYEIVTEVPMGRDEWAHMNLVQI